MNTRIRYGGGLLAGVAIAATVALAVYRRSVDGGVPSSYAPGKDRFSSPGSERPLQPPGSGDPGPVVSATDVPETGAGLGNPNKPLPNALRPLITAAVQGLMAETDPTRHRESLEAALAKVADGDLGLALAVLTDPEFAASGKELRQRLLERWGAQDPRAATAWIGRMSAGEARDEAFADVARGWAARDAEGARTWALALSEPSARDGALIQVGYELARTRPVEAMELAIAMQPTGRRDELLNYSATQWASQAPEEAVDWASQVSDEALRNRLLKDIFTEWGDGDPMAAATAAVKSMPAGREQNDTVVGIVQRWAQTEPKTAGAWVSAFPDGELRETAGRELITIWADQVVEEAGQWLDALPAGSFRDTAVSAYVAKILPMVPETASEWAMQIADPVLRAEELERVGAGWLESDAAAARAWIAQSALSAESKARLLSPPQPPTAAPKAQEPVVRSPGPNTDG
jgi:hypothetical protein